MRIWLQTDRLFAALFLVQWVAAMAAALWLTPRTWSGRQSTTHLHLWMSVYGAAPLLSYHAPSRCRAQATRRRVMSSPSRRC